MQLDWKTYLILVLIILAGLFLRLFVAWQDITVLMEKIVPDDSFFVFRIAQEIAKGNGLTFDGVIPSNSPRLIWELILAMVFKLNLPGYSLPVNIICTISSIADIGTVLMIFLILMRLVGDRFIALWGAGVYAFLPYAIMRMNNGLETSLGIFLVMFTLYLFIKFYKGKGMSYRNSFIIGVMCGVVILTRLDYGLLLVFIVAFMTFLEGIGDRYKKILVVISGSAVLLVPWMVWSYIRFGSILPSSAYAITYLYLEEFFHLSEPTFSGFLSKSWYFFYKALRCYAFPFLAIRMFYFGPIAFILLIVGGIYAFFRLSGEGKRDMFIGMTPLMMVFILLVLHGFIGWYAREWHSGPSYPGTVLLMGFILYALVRSRTEMVKRYIYIISVVLMIPILVRIGYRDWSAEPYKFILNHYNVSIWARDNLPEDAIIGSFDGGIPGYVSERRVIDLIGIENRYAFEERKKHKLGEYIDKEGVDYLIVLPIRISERYKIGWGEDITRRLIGPLYYADNESDQYYWERISVIYKVIQRDELEEENKVKFSFPPHKPDENIIDLYPK